MVANLDDKKLHDIASEMSDVRQERESLQQRLSALESGRTILYEHIGKPMPNPIARKQFNSSLAMRLSTRVKNPRLNENPAQARLHISCLNISRLNRSSDEEGEDKGRLRNFKSIQR